MMYNENKTDGFTSILHVDQHVEKKQEEMKTWS